MDFGLSQGHGIGLGQVQGTAQIQTQTLAPLQIQRLNLLQYDSLELAQQVKEVLLQNPVLIEERPAHTVSMEDVTPPADGGRREREFDGDAREFHDEMLRRTTEEPTNPESGPGTSLQRARDLDAEERRRHYLDSFSPQKGLREQLEEQADAEYRLRPKLAELCKLFCGAVDSRGYLPSDEELREEFPDLTPKQLERGVQAVQALEPAGIGARNLRECLLLQLRRQGLYGSLDWDIVDKHLEELARNKIPQIAAAIDAEVDEVQEARERIRQLNPNPGWTLYFEPSPTIDPDVYVDLEDGVWSIRANRESVPLLKLDPQYVAMCHDKSQSKETRQWLRGKVAEASNLIEGIDERLSTIVKVATKLVELQPEYFQSGRKSDLRPLKQADMAAALNYSAPTISRALANKYISTPWGVRPFSFFFPGGVKAAEGEEEVTSIRIRERLRAIVDAEDKKKPLSDEAIAARLREEGLNVARRTIAKYRALDQIPGTAQRKIHG